MKILLSNDDGVHAPGLAVLAQCLSEIATIHVVAPDRNRSAASNSLTLENPLRVRQLANGFHSVEGTPTDCVHLAMTGLLDELPDIVVAGINAGANLGDDVIYSGTVAAAIEGRYLGLPAIAVSLVDGGTLGQHHHYEAAALCVKELILKLQADSVPLQTILNVNVPNLPWSALRGMAITRLGSRHAAEGVIKMTDPRGQDIFWIGLPGMEQDGGPGTDFWAIRSKQVSITPLQLDLTHYKVFDELANKLDGFMEFNT